MPFSANPNIAAEIWKFSSKQNNFSFSLSFLKYLLNVKDQIIYLLRYFLLKVQGLKRGLHRFSLRSKQAYPSKKHHSLQVSTKNNLLFCNITLYVTMVVLFTIQKEIMTNYFEISTSFFRRRIFKPSKLKEVR